MDNDIDATEARTDGLDHEGTATCSGNVGRNEEANVGELIFHLFDKSVMRFSELERAIPGVSQKMLIQQLRELERDGVVQRTVYPQVPPKVEYRLTQWGEAMCPALDSLLEWAAARPPRTRHEAD
jgi:DNA-binding HxlR family transcriptional regulator